MNHKLIISRVVLSSALLMSAVAGPAISNAATKSPNPEQIPMLQKVISSNTSSTDAITGVAVVNSFTNPLDLAKKYAPDTLADWQETLDQYEKTIGKTLSIVSSTIEATPAVASGKETISISKGEISATLVSKAAKTSTKLEVVPDAVVKLDEQDGTKIQMAQAVVSEADSSDMAFIRAEIKLAQAVQSEDSDAIKESLGKLLEQYKQQIAEWKAEK
ncbi:hypothetical protein [Bacillus sp. FJAT-28004]|uniref:hypothetical protein n=1 Tax=Bacillus sp. FJAT-28004 TaxID=1679165 RepID=UPI0006B5CC65|nr:hypothetical protein [Bacillus sp. FJAT-28004]